VLSPTSLQLPAVTEEGVVTVEAVAAFMVEAVAFTVEAEDFTAEAAGFMGLPPTAEAEDFTAEAGFMGLPPMVAGRAWVMGGVAMH
jgi:hypothetical protein